MAKCGTLKKNNEDFYPVTDSSLVFYDKKNLYEALTEFKGLIEQGCTDEQLYAAIQSKVDDGTIANLSIPDNSITAEKIDSNLVNELKNSGYVYDSEGHKYKISVVNGEIKISRIYEDLQNKVFSIPKSSWVLKDGKDGTGYYDYEAYDELNNEILNCYNKEIYPFKSFTGKNLNTLPTKAKEKLLSNTSGAYTLIIQSETSKNSAMGKFFNEKLSIGTVFLNDSWDNIKVSVSFDYLDTSDTIQTFSPEGVVSVYKPSECAPRAKNWLYSFSVFVLEKDGSINIYYCDKLMAHFDAPSDFKSWSWSWIDSAWNYGNLMNRNQYDKAYDKAILLNDSLSLNGIEEYYKFLTNDTKVSQIKSINNLYLQIGDIYKLYLELLPSGIDEKIYFTSSDETIVTISDKGEINAISEGEATITVKAGDIILDIYVCIGKQVSDSCVITNERTITDIVLVEIPKENLEVGDEYPIYAIGINETEDLPYTVSTPNLLDFSSSDPLICSVQYGVLKANKEGSATITVKSLDATVIKTFDVNVVEADNLIIPERDIYHVDDRTHNIYNDGTHSEETTTGIQQALNYASENNYKKIVFNRGKYIVNGDYGSIVLPSNIIIDWQDSDIIIEYGTKSTQGYQMFKTSGAINMTMMNVKFYGENFTKTGGSKSNESLIVNGNSKNCKFINCHFLYSSGFNVGCDYSRATIKGFKLSNVEAGGLDDTGVNDDTDTTNRYRSIDYIDLGSTGGTFILGNMQGYQGYKYMSSRLYNIYFFDENKEFISMLKYCVQYQQYDKPSNAKYCKIMFFQNFIPTSGDPDFNSIAHICTLTQPENIKFINCSFKYAVMTGISPQGTKRLLLDNCLFEDNGSSDPYAHIDWEDGRIHIQGHVVRHCTFKCTDNTKWHSNVAMLNGRDIAFHDNEYIGAGKLYLTSEMQNARIYRNKFLDNTTVSLASKTDMVYASNISKTEATVGDVLEGMQIIQDNNIVI